MNLNYFHNKQIKNMNIIKLNYLKNLAMKKINDYSIKSQFYNKFYRKKKMNFVNFIHWFFFLVIFNIFTASP